MSQLVADLWHFRLFVAQPAQPARPRRHPALAGARDRAAREAIDASARGPATAATLRTRAALPRRRPARPRPGTREGALRRGAAAGHAGVCGELNGVKRTGVTRRNSDELSAVAKTRHPPGGRRPAETPQSRWRGKIGRAHV